MLYLSIIVLLIALFILTLLLEKITNRFEGYYFYLVISFSFVAFAITCLFLNNKISEKLNDIFSYILLSISIILILSIAVYSFFSKSRASKYQRFLEALEENQVFLLTDKKDRIKMISTLLLSELDVKKDEVIGKNWFEVVDKHFRIKKYNDLVINNNEYANLYKKYRNEAYPDLKKKIELVYANAKGTSTVLTLLECPTFSLFGYSGRITTGGLRNDYLRLKSEKELDELKDNFNSLQTKFVGMFDLVSDNILFYDIETNTIWLNDSFKKELELEDNSLSFNDYVLLMNESDALLYKDALKKPNIDNPNYKISYRIKNGEKEIYYEETGTRLFDDASSKTIVAKVNKIDLDGYSKTGFNELDNAKDEDNLYDDLKNFYAKKKSFQLVYLSFYNVPEINERYGRKIGNMSMDSYLKEFRNKFLSESSEIYRVGGLDFAITICDTRRMTDLKKELNNSPDALDLEMKFGSSKLKVRIKAGIASSFVDGSNPKEIFDNAKYANKLTHKEQFNTNCLFFSDVK